MKTIEQIALELYPVKMVGSYSKGTFNCKKDENEPLREALIRGYNIFKDKITEQHISGLEWISRSGISTQPVPYHKYCKDLYNILKES